MRRHFDNQQRIEHHVLSVAKKFQFATNERPMRTGRVMAYGKPAKAARLIATI